MTKKQKLSKDEQEKATMEKMEKRVENLLPSKDAIPASMSIQQTEELKTRIIELEEKLAQQSKAAQEHLPTSFAETDQHSLPVRPVEDNQAYTGSLIFIIRSWVSAWLPNTMRGKLIFGFIGAALLTVITSYIGYSQFAKVNEVADALKSLSPMATYTQYMQHDINAYLLNHPEHRQEFEAHAAVFNQDWDKFQAHQSIQGGVPAEEQPLMEIIEASRQEVQSEATALFDLYDEQNRTWKIVDELGDEMDSIVQEMATRVDSEYLLNVSELGTAVQYMQHDVNAYLLGNLEHRAEFAEHSDKFESLLATLPAVERGKIQPVFTSFKEGAIALFDIYDQTLTKWKVVDELGDQLDATVGELVSGHNAELTAVQSQANNLLLTTAVLSFVIALALGIFFATIISNPVRRLTGVAQQIAAGNISAQASIESSDEIGVLAKTFNQMTSQIRNLIGTLEQSAHDLQLASEVGRTITEKVDNVYAMLSEATEIIRSRFNLYYTQVYLVDPSGRTLTLSAGTGEAGKQLLQRGHHLLIGSGSLNGQAVSEKKPIIVANTAKSVNFLPNPLLPNTRSEMAVPLIVSGQVLGVLDMQSEIPDTLNQSNLPAFEALAGQLSIAIQNASLFAQSEEARKNLEANVRQTTNTGWQDFLNGVERSKKIGYTFNQTEVTVLENVKETQSINTLSVPITITGATIGAIQIMEEERAWTEHEAQIVQATADQLAQHIDNLRLLMQAESYRAEAELVSRRLTREGWGTYLQTRSTLASGYSYNLNEIKIVNTDIENNSVSALTRPITVHNEAVGELLIHADNINPNEVDEIFSAVATQLGNHIENLRLSEQNEKRAYELATVATVSTTASTVLDPDKLLQAVVDLTKERFNMYHTHIYLVDESWNTLLLAASAGEIGKQMVVAGHAIEMDAEKSLVARASRARKAIIVNDVRTEAGFLPNEMLPETRAEIAVPMIVGDKVLGVFDVQSNHAGQFTEEDANIYTTLAAQVAVALQNARLYQEQSATVTQLRELDKLKSSFLANMSHELRTPLNSILGFADVILEELDGPLTENMTNDLGLIQKNGQHLLHMINDVLDMAKIESGKLNLIIEKISIHEVFEDVISITSSLAKEKNLSLIIDKKSNGKAIVNADRTRLRQVMINLVNNALKFTEKGNIMIHASQEEDNNVLISIKDTGIGIPPTQLEEVFQEFTQVDSSTTRKVGGTGLGLPISRKLIEMHGGKLWAESSGIHGEGSTFFIYMPVESINTISEPVTRKI